MRVDADIPFGNVAEVEIVTRGDGVELSFTPHPHGGPEVMWFCFRVVRTQEQAPPVLHLRLRHAANLLGAHAEAFRPVVRLPGGNWMRLDAPKFIQQPDGQLEVVWAVPTPQVQLDVAWCYPYGKTELMGALDTTGDYWSCDSIGVSHAGRSLLRLANQYGAVDHPEPAPGVYFIARQHAGETPGSWTLDGFLRRLAERDEQRIVIWGVPLANIDGIEQGDYGKDNYPYDINRAWGTPPYRHENHAIQNDVRQWEKRCKPTALLDFHSPGAGESHGIYCYAPPEEDFPEAYARTEGLIASIRNSLGELASGDFARVGRYPSRWSTPSFTRLAWAYMKTAALALEIPYAMNGDQVLTIEHYRQAGARIADGLLAEIVRD